MINPMHPENKSNLVYDVESYYLMLQLLLLLRSVSSISVDTWLNTYYYKI